MVAVGSRKFANGDDETDDDDDVVRNAKSIIILSVLAWRSPYKAKIH